jgi:hypothetical protein
VAALYAGNNCLVLFVLAKVDLGSFVVWRNTTVVFQALIWTFILNRTLKVNQWAAVGFLFIGCCLNSFDTDGSTSDVVGLPALLLLTSALASATAAALNESVLKREALQELGIDGLNVLLYVQTLSLLCAWLLLRAALAGRPVLAELPRLLAGLDRSAAGLVIVQTLLGLTVARVLRYADAVAKTVAGGFREIVQVLVAPVFVTSRLDWISLASVFWIATAAAAFFVPALQKGDSTAAATSKSRDVPELAGSRIKS